MNDKNFDRSITDLIRRSDAGEAGAFGELIEATYSVLRERAEYAGRDVFGKGYRDVTFSPTAIVNEAVANLVGKALQSRNRREFFALAAKVMRDLAVSRVRNRAAQKRGWGRHDPAADVDRVAAIEEREPREGTHEQFLRAFDLLLEEHALAAEVFTLRAMGEMSIRRTSELLDLPEERVKTLHRSARTFLHREMSQIET